MDFERLLASETIGRVLVTTEVASRVLAANTSQVVFVIGDGGRVGRALSVALVRIEEPSEIVTANNFFSSITRQALIRCADTSGTWRITFHAHSVHICEAKGTLLVTLSFKEEREVTVLITRCAIL